MFIYLAISLITYLIYLKWDHHNRYLKYGLKGRRGLPIIGNFLDIRRITFVEYERKNFLDFGPTYYDYIFSRSGCITTSNPEYAKKILIKDFQNFYYRVQPKYLPKYARVSLIFSKEDWKRIRTQVSPVFSSGRLKLMYKNFEYPIQNCLDNIDEIINSKKNDNVEVKNLMLSFTLDIIGNVVFSLKTNAYKKDEFSKRVLDLFNPRLPLVALSFVLPKFISKFFDLSLFNYKTVLYFAELSLKLIEERKNHKEIVYNDFIELLLKSESKSEVKENFDKDGHVIRKLSVEEIIGQCLVFFTGGMETVANALVHLFLELAIHQDIQEKLYQDILINFPNDDIAYEEIIKSKYLDCVVNENLRMHPALNRLFRVASADYDFGEFKIKKGQTMGISVLNLHYDESLFPDGDKFIPERFETGKVDTNLIFSFGAGPRQCVAERFALLELKSLTIKLLKKFKFFTNEKTFDFKYKPAVIVSMVEDMRLRIERR